MTLQFGINAVGAFCSKNFTQDALADNCVKEFKLDAIPPLERRRLGNATKCAFSLMPDLTFRTKPKIIFSSYSGEIHSCLSLLKTLDLESVVSPTQFSLSVLNATPASIAIATHNQSEISAISATPSLEYGFINADSTEETLLIAYEEYLNKEGFEYLMVLVHLDKENYKKELQLGFEYTNEDSLDDMLHPLQFVKQFHSDSAAQWEHYAGNLCWKWNLK